MGSSFKISANSDDNVSSTEASTAWLVRMTSFPRIVREEHYFRPRLREFQRESFHVLLLDGRHRLIGLEAVSIGTLTASLVHPREVFREAIRRAAAAMLLVHNHPSGDPVPSIEDRDVTRRLQAAGELLGIRVLDHVIVAEEGYYSFREQDPSFLEPMPLTGGDSRAGECQFLPPERGDVPAQ